MNPTATQPEVRHLPPLDTAKIEKAAAEWVQTRLTGITDPEQVAAAAGKIVETEKRAKEKALLARDMCVYTLETRYRLCRGADLAGALGMASRSRLTVIRKQMKALADRGELVYTPNAAEVLPKLAAEAARHAARWTAAKKVRDKAVNQLLASGRSNADVGRLIGRHASRVSHLKHKTQEVA